MIDAGPQAQLFQSATEFGELDHHGVKNTHEEQEMINILFFLQVQVINPSTKTFWGPWGMSDGPTGVDEAGQERRSSRPVKDGSETFPRCGEPIPRETIARWKASENAEIAQYKRMRSQPDFHVDKEQEVSLDFVNQ